jgi:hypothetical protein
LLVTLFVNVFCGCWPTRHGNFCCIADEILTLISNELCGPISSIVSLSCKLAQSPGFQNAPNLSKMMDVITQSGRRLLEFIYSMTSQAQLSTDSLVVQHQQVDVVPLVQDVAMLASHLLGSNVELKLDLHPVPLVLGAPGRIVQVRSPCTWSLVSLQRSRFLQLH